MFFPLHILFMTVSTLGIVAGISTAVFFRRKKNWLNIHKSVNALSLLGISAGIFMAFLYVSSSGGKHINGFHQVSGLAAFTFALITLLLGFYQFKAINKPPVRTAHRWLGRVSILMFLTAIISGLIFINIL